MSQKSGFFLLAFLCLSTVLQASDLSDDTVAEGPRHRTQAHLLMFDVQKQTVGLVSHPQYLEIPSVDVPVTLTSDQALKNHVKEVMGFDLSHHPLYLVARLVTTPTPWLIPAEIWNALTFGKVSTSPKQGERITHLYYAVNVESANVLLQNAWVSISDLCDANAAHARKPMQCAEDLEILQQIAQMRIGGRVTIDQYLPLVALAAKAQTMQLEGHFFFGLALFESEFQMNKQVEQGPARKLLHGLSLLKTLTHAPLTLASSATSSSSFLPSVTGGSGHKTRMVACFVAHEAALLKTYFQEVDGRHLMPSVVLEPHRADLRTLYKLGQTIGADVSAENVQPFFFLEHTLPQTLEKQTTLYYLIGAKPTAKGIWSTVGENKLWPEIMPDGRQDSSLKPLDDKLAAQFIHNALNQAWSATPQVRPTMQGVRDAFATLINAQPGAEKIGHLLITTDAFKIYKGHRGPYPAGVVPACNLL